MHATDERETAPPLQIVSSPNWVTERGRWMHTQDFECLNLIKSIMSAKNFKALRPYRKSFSISPKSPFAHNFPANYTVELFN